MIDFFNELVLKIGLPIAFTCIAGLSAWLGSIWRDRINEKIKAKNADSIEHLKAENQLYIEELKSVHNRETQTLEHQLQIERHAAQIGQARLIEKRAIFIDENYKLLVDLNNAIYDTFRPDYFGRSRPTTQQAYELALPKFDVFVDSFEKNRIYFTKTTSLKVSKFYVAAAQALDQSRAVVASNETLGRGETPQLQKLFDAVEHKMQEAREALEKDFRELMYVQE
jgi:hypothetical protein